MADIGSGKDSLTRKAVLSIWILLGISRPSCSQLDCSHKHNWLSNNVTSSMICVEYSLPSTFRESLEICSNMTSHLVTINSSAEQSVILDAVSPKLVYYMGANDIAKEGGWQWQESGESLTYSNWNTGEPNNHGHVEDCGTLVGGQGFWNDMPCSTKLMFICEMEAAPPTVSPTQPPTKVTPESTPMASTIDNDNLAEDKSSYNICSCRCKLFAGKPLNITSDDLNVMMARTRQELTVDKRRTSLFNRTKLSIEDRRLSSQVLGFFGASILTLLFICIALPDLLACLRSIYSKRLHHQHCQYL